MSVITLCHKANMAPKRKRNQKQTEKQKKVKTPITILNKLCDLVLIKIFMHLSKEDLVNVIEFDSRLINAARLTAIKKFKHVIITNKHEPTDPTTPIMVKYLSYFGSTIQFLDVRFHSEYRRNDDMIENAIYNYCANTLQGLRLVNVGLLTMCKIREPFANVKCVSIYRGVMFNILSDFDYWFPQAHTLEVRSCVIKNHLIKNQFPSVKHFNFTSFNNSIHPNVVHEFLQPMIEFNPQLQFVQIIGRWRLPSSIESLIEILVKLPELMILEMSAMTITHDIIEHKQIMRLLEGCKQLFWLMLTTKTFNQEYYMFDIGQKMRDNRRITIDEWRSRYRRKQLNHRSYVLLDFKKFTNILIVSKIRESMPFLNVQYIKKTNQ